MTTNQPTTNELIAGLQSIPFDPARAVYLAVETGVKIPKKFLQYIVNGDLINNLAWLGLEGAKVHYDIEDADRQLNNLYVQGRDSSEARGTEQEWRLRISSAVGDALDVDPRLSFTNKLSLWGHLSKWISSTKLDDLVMKESGDIGDGESHEIAKWVTGFDPYDLAMGATLPGGGFYHGVHVLMAEPGSGKTSTFLKVMGDLRKNNRASSLWYFSLETPKAMIQARMNPILQDVVFIDGKDKIFAGLWTIQEILELIAEDPDPDRIILYDGPDVLAQGEGKRHILEDIYRDLVVVKGLCKSVFVSSQPRRERDGMSLQSLAEAWAKAWFADSVTGIEKVADKVDQRHFLKITNFKSRFGPSMTTQIYSIDYATFEYELLDSHNWRTAIHRTSGTGDGIDDGGW
ncbi:MAG: hypothetical protein JRE40_00355 [Deltaproteobacteria bacterium]|nr:hypothetical protein [Deltaproteobacteria bacterium]